MPSFHPSRRRRWLAAFGAVIVVGVLLAVGRPHVNALASSVEYRLRRPMLSIRGDTSWVGLGFYEPFETTTLDSVPQPLRERLDSLLLDHVGAEYRNRLFFVHAVIVDHGDSAFRAETRDYEWPVHEYRVGYALRGPVEGVRTYVGYVTLYPSNDRAPIIEFPPVRTHPDRAHLVPLYVAQDSAEAHGVYPFSANLHYDRRSGRLQYFLRGRGPTNGLTGSDPVAIIDAHTGRLVALTHYTWIS